MRIVAVVVTFNRLALLTELIERLREIDGLDDVLVIDNASTDGTGAWLQEAGVRHRTLAENLGGAGGFHDGLDWAMREGAELAWLMDDDGLPDPDCLDLLLAHEADFDFWGPAVVDRDDPHRLVFPIRLPGTTRVVHDIDAVERAAVDGVIADVVIPFNGVLIRRELVQRIGLIRAELFIWGDDHEYRLRAERAGARIGTVVDARVRHPAVGALGTPMMWGRTTYNHSPSDLKHYCMARNNLINLRDYRGWPVALLFVAKTIWFYLFTRPDVGRLMMSFRAMWAGLRGDFTGHRKYLAPPSAPVAAPSTLSAPTSVDDAGARPGTPGTMESVAVVIVTYNRAELLPRTLTGLAAQTHAPGAVIVVDNASTDATAQVLDEVEAGGELPQLIRIRNPENLGGAGGFHAGAREAYRRGYDRIWLMDDDVVPAPDALAVLMAQDEDCLTTVREDLDGNLVEKAALRFDLRSPWAIKPKTAMVETTYHRRSAMPARVAVENVAFEGFMIRRSVLTEIGLPDPSYFIFYDDVDLAVRARRAGRTIWAIRDARLIRQLEFSQQHDLSGWKGYYMYRNLFVVHLRYGENALVRAKPWLIAAGVVALSPVRGGPREARNVIRALRDARGMRSIPSRSVD